MKPKLNLRQIESFYAVMRTGTVVGAAQLMSVTQPAVSRAIGLLEIRVGYKLFERRGRKLVATPEGDALYREIEPVYGSLDRIAQLAEDIRHQRAGALRIATLPSVSQSLLPRAIARFLSTRPKVSVYVQSLPSRQIADLVATRQFDVGLIELPLSRPAISIEPLEPTPAMAVIPVGHRLAAKRQVSIRDLAGERMILLSQHSFLRHQIDDAFSKYGVSADAMLETPHSLVACGLVAAGVGITLVSRWAAEAFSTADVVVRPVRDELTSRSAIIFPYPGARLLLAEAFAKDLREEIRTSKRR
ncbi:Transcriptional regulator, LysR family [Cupriavidus taiwanensis]|uniref:Transcriptional regulator, LysR family n=1 Tax=Cupriavidus taiwanensis TaxID=164546 RepID=A0A375CQQ7_9BURK|nr:LysR family transcriptional regulator [Cupriavidus taiwanensis]SOY77754.1 Transcriptional regulator, LysR family [Cupriavidus taiwanensis]